MKTMLYTTAVILLVAWAISFIVFNASNEIHALLAIDFLIILKALKPEKEERITRITSERNYIK